MNVRSAADVIRQLVFTAHKIRHASTVSLPPTASPEPAIPLPTVVKSLVEEGKPRHGHQIWVYNHLQTKQVVYSLSKTMKNNKALGQLPFNGKKTVPRALRKDLWAPLAAITFPGGRKGRDIGLSTFTKLRELRRLHETLWDREEMTEEIELEEGGKKVIGLSRKKRGRKLMDQKANSVADVACVLGAIGTDGPWGTGGMKRHGKKMMVEVRWRDLADAEYAETWADRVVHDVLPRTGHVIYGEILEALAEAKREEERKIAEEKARLEAEANGGKVKVKETVTTTV